MSGRSLLDTNIIIALFAGEPVVRERLGQIDETFVPSIAIGELYFGAHKSGRVHENLMRVDEFTASNVILGCDAETARWYGEIKSLLREKGRPIPENDIWIAAIALQHRLTLISRDAHFSAVDNLQLEMW